ncbi:hypothetical protein B0H10DRAFT_2211191 [Mycena sp. CBHHK59/15]|nr:hypothetical protein B0H10DRAFT_2211191 [Mycena sp. CBHHK59/15]
MSPDRLLKIVQVLAPVFEAWFSKFPMHAKLGLPIPTELEDSPVLTDAQLQVLGDAMTKQKKVCDASGAKSKTGFDIDGQGWRTLLKPTRFRRHQPIEIFQKRNKEPIREALTEAGFDGLNEEQVSKTMGIDDWSVPEDEPTPAEYQLAIDETGEVFHRVHELVSHKAGWKGFTIVGGPNPRLGGALSMKIICEGVSPAGNDFQAAHASFEESVGIPFQQWLKRVFPLAVRRARAVSTPDDAGVDIDEDVVLDEDQQESQPAPKLKKPKRMNKPKGKKAAEATPAAVTPAASTPTDSSDSATIPVPTPAVMPALDSPRDIFDTNTSDSDETLFSSGNTSFHHMDVDPSPLASARNTCWPEGMPPPTSPGTAAMAAMIERGGLPGGATYAIDPFLLTTPSPTASAPQRPCPQPAFKGAASATPTQTRTHHVGGFNFPVLTESSPSCSSSSSPSRMPFLFDAFRKNTAAPLAPAVVPSPYTPSSALFQNTGATPFVWLGTSTASMHAAPLVGFTNMLPVVSTNAVSVASANAAPVVSTNAPALSLIAPPVISANAPAAAPAYPQSRPMAKPPTSLMPPIAKPAAGRKPGKPMANPKKTAWKKSATDSGSAAAATTATTVLGETTNTPIDPNTLIFTTTNNNRAAIAADNKRQAQAVKAAKLVPNLRNPDGESELVVVPAARPSRAVKARALPDGTTIQRQKKLTRAEMAQNKHAKSEALLLQRQKQSAKVAATTRK